MLAGSMMDGKAKMRALLAAALTAMGLLTTPSSAQEVPGSQGVAAPGEASGHQEGTKRKGHRATDEKTSPQTTKADEKAYRSALDGISNQKYDPWRTLR
jgi:Spy/CpxP family protein refolding chaperone